jgi:hypothetical protein
MTCFVTLDTEKGCVTNKKWSKKVVNKTLVMRTNRKNHFWTSTDRPTDRPTLEECDVWSHQCLFTIVERLARRFLRMASRLLTISLGVLAGQLCITVKGMSETASEYRCCQGQVLFLDKL